MLCWKIGKPATPTTNSKPKNERNYETKL
jgi:hypothetical protein